MPKILAAVLLTAVLGACASNTETVTDADGKVVEVQEEKQKMRCTRGRGTGSRIADRVCVPIDD